MKSPAGVRNVKRRARCFFPLALIVAESLTLHCYLLLYPPLKDEEDRHAYEGELQGLSSKAFCPPTVALAVTTSIERRGARTSTIRLFSAEIGFPTRLLGKLLSARLHGSLSPNTAALSLVSTVCMIDISLECTHQYIFLVASSCSSASEDRAKTRSGHSLHVSPFTASSMRQCPVKTTCITHNRPRRTAGDFRSESCRASVAHRATPFRRATL